MERDANDHATRPGWHYNALNGFYTWHSDNSVDMVWLVRPGHTWAASVHVGARQATGHQFASMTEAQVWCEEMIARFVAADTRTKERQEGA